MLCRVALLAIAVIVAGGGCEFEHGVAPGPSDGKLDDGVNVDASPCAAIAIEAGGDHTCAISATGTLYCWGRGNDGQLGVDPLSYQCVANTVYCQPTPLEVTTPQAMIAVGAGAFHTCAASAQQAYCWGKNNTSQYGDNSISLSTTPKPIAERAGATAFDGGSGHTCSLQSGTLYCSGANSEGQVGNASVIQQGMAAPVMMNVASFSLGNSTTCAIDTGRKLFCWGRNTYKTIDPSTNIKTIPTAVAGGVDVVSVGVGADHVCAAFGSGAAKCWGLNSNGQLGNGMTNATAQPMTLVAVPSAVEVAASRNHSCVRTDADEVYCFGEGYTPTPALIVTGAAQLTAGSSHDCALLRDGTIRCWGDQTYGQLGNNVEVSARTTTPQTASLCR